MESQDLKQALEAHYQASYDGCSQQRGEPCGEERAVIEKTKAFRDVSRPAVGPAYGMGRKVLFVGMNPGSYESDRHEFEDYFDEGNPHGWDERDFRTALFRMAGVAAGPGVSHPASRAAWINLVKCASRVPDESGTNPTFRMWLHCTPKSRAELELLAPDLIIALGDETHSRLLEATSHWGWRVRVPRSPYSRFWGELSLGSRRVGVFSAVHPNGLQVIRRDWKQLKEGESPSRPMARLLEARSGKSRPSAWRKHVLEVLGSDEGDPLVRYLEALFLPPGAPLGGIFYGDGPT